MKNEGYLMKDIGISLVRGIIVFKTPLFYLFSLILRKIEKIHEEKYFAMNDFVILLSRKESKKFI